ncbi:trypsin-like serine peptidase [Botrytis cinerea]
MDNNKRILRSSVLTTHTTDSLPSKPIANLEQPVRFISNKSSQTTPRINEKILLIPRSSTLRGLNQAELTLLRKKQSQLKATALSTLKDLPSGIHVRNLLASALIFAQYEAGTAVCIDPAGWIITCSHCIGETEKEWKAKPRQWLLYYTGLAIEVECRAWDQKRDLALLKVVTMEIGDDMIENTIPEFSFVKLAVQPPKQKISIICIGQPGSDDLESSGNRKTKYNLVEVSEGSFCGMIHGQDPHENSEIGSLKHDAWTYWGHSGAPLVRADDGLLIGLHSSWDENTAMRHGVPLVAMRGFLEECLPSAMGLGGIET